MSENVPSETSFEATKGSVEDAFDCSWPEELFTSPSKPTAKLLHASLGRFPSLMTSEQPTKLNRSYFGELAKSGIVMIID